MGIKLYNTQLEKINPQQISQFARLNSYSAHMVPMVSYFNIPQDIKVLWFDDFAPNHLGPWQPTISVDVVNNSFIDVVIIPFSDHPFCLCQAQVDYIKLLTKPFVITSPTQNGDLGFNEELFRENCVFLPYWAMTYPIEAGVIVPSKESAMQTDRKYLFSCLNGNPTYTRLVNLIWIVKNNHVFTNENSIVTCPARDRDPGSPDVACMVNELNETWPEGADIFQSQLEPRLPFVHYDIKPIQFDVDDYQNILSCNHAAFLNSYINIVIETEAFYPFISEKSLKPIVAGQLFVTTGLPGTIDQLREIGFDVFDDIFEHSRYSEYSNVLMRLKALHKRLEEISTRDWAEIYRATEKRRLSNRELLLSGDISRKYFQRLEQKINECI